MGITLYSMGISHPARAAGLMIDHKGLEHRRVDIPTACSRWSSGRPAFAG